MTSLADDRFLSATLFDLPLAEVDLIAGTVLARIGQTSMVRYPSPLDLNEIYVGEPPAGGAHPYKFVLYEPVAPTSCTVMVTNLADGWNSLAWLISKEHPSRQLQIRSSRKDDEYPVHELQIVSRGQEERLVRVMRDSDRWEFFERGPRRDFEDIEGYSARLVRKRLDRPKIVSYLHALGWDVESADFWRSERPAIYYDRAASFPKH